MSPCIPLNAKPPSVTGERRAVARGGGEGRGCSVQERWEGEEGEESSRKQEGSERVGTTSSPTLCFECSCNCVEVQKLVNEVIFSFS